MGKSLGTDSPVKRMTQELPWGFSGQESVCQCREQRFDPWFGKIPHTMGQLESVLRSCGSPQALKPVLRNRRSHRSERASHRNREEPLSATTREPSGPTDQRQPKIIITINLNQKDSDAKNKQWGVGVTRGEGLE